MVFMALDRAEESFFNMCPSSHTTKSGPKTKTSHYVHPILPSSTDNENYWYIGNIPPLSENINFNLYELYEYESFILIQYILQIQKT